MIFNYHTQSGDEFRLSEMLRVDTHGFYNFLLFTTITIPIARMASGTRKTVMINDVFCSKAGTTAVSCVSFLVRMDI